MDMYEERHIFLNVYQGSQTSHVLNQNFYSPPLNLLLPVFYSSKKAQVKNLRVILHTDGQQVHEKILKITNHQRNANQNHKVPPNMSQNGHH